MGPNQVDQPGNHSVVGLGGFHTFSGDLKAEAYDLDSRENVRENASEEIIGPISSGRHSL